MVFWAYDLDIIQSLLNALGHRLADGTEVTLSRSGQALTALLIAGGSDGIFRIFTKLGIRNPKERKQKAEAEQALLKQIQTESGQPPPA